MKKYAFTFKTVTAKELADAVEMTVQWLGQLANNGWFPKAKRGVYEWKPTVSGLIRYYRSQAQADERKENMRLRNAHLQHSLDLKQEKILLKDHVALIVTRAFTAFRSRMLAIPSTVAARIALVRNEAEVEALIRDQINEALMDLQKCKWVEPSKKRSRGSRT